jgi:hypothetical protein
LRFFDSIRPFIVSAIPLKPSSLSSYTHSVDSITSLLVTGIMGEIFMAAEPIPNRQHEVKDRGASLLGGLGAYWAETFEQARVVNDADEFRKQAEQAREMAERALSQEEKAFWLRMAEDWLRLAQARSGFRPAREAAERSGWAKFQLRQRRTGGRTNREQTQGRQYE